MRNSYRNKVRCILLWAVTAVLCAGGSFAGRVDVKLPPLFSDHMVLQEDTSVPIWGWAEPGEEVTVTIQQQVRRTKADANGKWMAKLRKLKGGAPTTL
jgi:sialate O-acetylesterase